MIYYFNTPFLYWEKCKIHEEIKKNILPLIEEDYSKNSELYRKNSNWGCNSTSSFHSELDSESDIINEKLLSNLDLFNSIFSTYNSMLENLFSDQVISEEELINFQDCYLEDLWYNYYQPGENQDIHEHTPNTFSGVYLLDVVGSNDTVWYNGSSTFPCDSRSVFDSRVSNQFDLGEGNIIIFPSRLAHFVPPTKNKKITISFNIRTNE